MMLVRSWFDEPAWFSVGVHTLVYVAGELEVEIK